MRGTTSIKIVEMVRRAGARAVHMRISSPPTRHPCFYGIATPERDELLAARLDVAGMAELIGVDSLAFLSIDGLYRAMGEAGRDDLAPHFCDACFTGDYPIPHVDADDGKVAVQLSASRRTRLKAPTVTGLARRQDRADHRRLARHRSRRGPCALPPRARMSCWRRARWVVSKKLDDAIRAAGGAATLVPLDLRDFIKIDELAAKLFDRYGRLDILVGNAAEFGVFSPLGHIDSGHLGRGHRPQPDRELAPDPGDGPAAARSTRRARDLCHLGVARGVFPYWGPMRSARRVSKCWSRSTPARSARPGCARTCSIPASCAPGCAPAPSPAKTRAACRRRTASPTPSLALALPDMHPQRRGGDGSPPLSA